MSANVPTRVGRSASGASGMPTRVPYLHMR
jgi:hypothetical protein